MFSFCKKKQQKTKTKEYTKDISFYMQQSKIIELIQYSISAVSAFNFCFPLDAFEYSDLSDTCRHISHPHIHKCMFRLHDDMKFRPCIPRTLKHTLIRMSSSHRLKKKLGQKWIFFLIFILCDFLFCFLFFCFANVYVNIIDMLDIITFRK